MTISAVGRLGALEFDNISAVWCLELSEFDDDFCRIWWRFLPFEALNFREKAVCGFSNASRAPTNAKQHHELKIH